MLDNIHQIRLLDMDIDIVLTLEQLYLFAKIFIITFILTCVFLLKGSMRSPLRTFYCRTSLVRNMYRFLARMRFTIEWELFIGMTSRSTDLRITAITDCGVKYEWFLLRDGDDIFDKRFCVNFKFSRVVLTTHYRRLFRTFLDKYWLDAAHQFCKDRELVLSSLVVDIVSFSSFAPAEQIENRQAPLKVYKTFTIF